MTPLAFFVQVKAQASSFDAKDRLSVETRHLRLWSEGNDVWVFFYSQADDAFRARSGKRLAAEADSIAPAWRDQESITIRFPPDTRVGGVLSLEQIRRLVADDLDRDGGSKGFHKHRRRVMLTDLYRIGQRYSTAQEFLAEGETGTVRVLEGPGWIDGDLDTADTDAERVLAGALLLYEEVWVIGSHLLSALATLGAPVLRSLLERDRIRPFGMEQHLSFFSRDAERRGAITALSLQTPHDPVKDLADRIGPLGGDRALAELMVRKTTLAGLDRANAIVVATEQDLANPEIRRLLGLTPSRAADHSEAIWDGRLATRMLYLNTCFAGAELAGADVVEFEAGLSRLASEKWYSAFRFHRLYQTALAFDAALRAIGIPDLGIVVRKTGIARLLEIADGPAAQDFRDWFWEKAAPSLRTNVGMEAQVHATVAKLIRVDSSILGLGLELKLSMVESTGQDYVVGSYGLPQGFGFSSRASRGVEALERQARIHWRSRQQRIRAVLGVTEVSPYERCPCQSGEKYKFCCSGSP